MPGQWENSLFQVHMHCLRVQGSKVTINAITPCLPLDMKCTGLFSSILPCLGTFIKSAFQNTNNISIGYNACFPQMKSLVNLQETCY